MPGASVVGLGFGRHRSRAWLSTMVEQREGVWEGASVSRAKVGGAKWYNGQ